MKSKQILVFLLIPILLLLFVFHRNLTAQEDCTQLINNAVAEFTEANFERAIQLFNEIINMPDFQTNCTPSEREKSYFYLSYCHYVLYGCRNQATQEATCNLKIYFPNFDPSNPDYKWVSQGWINCLNNVECSNCDLIARFYNLGKNQYSNKNYISAVQNLINTRVLIESGPRPPDCPEYDQYNNFSSEYLSICESRLIENWNKHFESNNYNQCYEMEKNLFNIEGHENYLQNFNSHIAEKKQSLVEQVNNSLQDIKEKLDTLLSIERFETVNFDELQNDWDILKHINKEWLQSENISLSMEMIPAQELLDSFNTFCRFATTQYDLEKERNVMTLMENYKNFIINNFPNSQEQVQSQYQKYINDPSTVFRKTNIGVFPPTRNTDFLLPISDCMRDYNIKGSITCGIIVGREGRVDKSTIIENNLDRKESYCIKDFEKSLLQYLDRIRFKPAYKVRYLPACTKPTGHISSANTINVRYYIERQFNLK
ncbi:MAG: hypothetical protein ACOC6P_01990 [Candidatus Aminicenantaceae bacterium]